MLSSCENFLIKHKRLVLAHRIALLEIMERIVSDTIDDLTPKLAMRLCKLGTGEMTEKQEIIPEWQSAAGRRPQPCAFLLFHLLLLRPDC